MSERLNFACDYNQGAHPAILRRMMESNLVKSGVYGDDAFSESARAKIREACAAPEADVWFLKKHKKPDGLHPRPALPHPSIDITAS